MSRQPELLRALGYKIACDFLSAFTRSQSEHPVHLYRRVFLGCNFVMSSLSIIFIIFLSVVHTSLADECSYDKPCEEKDNVQQVCIKKECHNVTKHNDTCLHDLQCQTWDINSYCHAYDKNNPTTKRCDCKSSTWFLSSVNVCQVKGFCETDSDCQDGSFQCKGHVCHPKTSGWVYVFWTLEVLALLVIVGIAVLYWRGRH